MTIIPTGGHLISGAVLEGGEVFESSPVSGAPRRFFSATASEVDAACRAAEAAFASYGWTSRETRARFLDGIAASLEDRAGEIVATAAAQDLHPGVFGLIQSFTVEGGTALVRHPLIRAVGFTGSLGAGRALFDLCAARPEPIPFFGELGSVNPMFLLPAALSARARPLGEGWAASLSMGVGQFCTNPGIALAIEGPDLDAFIDAAQTALGGVTPQPMLTEGIAAAYRRGRNHLAEAAGVSCLVRTEADGRFGAPALFSVAASDFLADRSLAHEVFGPAGILVRVRDTDEMVALAATFEGQLTATLQMDDGDTDLARRLLPILERKAGRVLANGFPTGVEVCDAMVHGGPYPASTNFGATSVGTLAIRRFLRPVSYQNLPDALLPEDLRLSPPG